MIRRVSYKEARTGDIIKFPECGVRVSGTNGHGDPMVGMGQLPEGVADALGATFWREEPTTFECNARILGAEPQVLDVNTLILEGVGQIVPTGRVKVTIEHVKGPVS